MDEKITKRMKVPMRKKFDAAGKFDRFDTNSTPECFSRTLETPKLSHAFLMLDPEYARKQGMQEEHQNMIQRASKISSGMGRAQDNLSITANKKTFDLYQRFRESSSRALDKTPKGFTKKKKSVGDVVAEIDAMSMETVMFSDAHMLETQIQQLSEIKKCFFGPSDGTPQEIQEEEGLSAYQDDIVNDNVKGSNIVLAISHKTSSTLISRWLIRSGFKVVKVSCGKQALKTIRKGNCDLCVCDIQLEEIDGLRLTEIIRNSEGLLHMPIILMSSSKMGEQAYEVGADDFLSKPVGKNILLKKVGTVLENALYKRMLHNTRRITQGDSKFDFDPAKVEIMVVDDDVVTRKIVSRWLTTNGYRVHLCKTGIEAWKRIQQLKKARDEFTYMILSDVTMPELSGFKLLEWVMADKNTRHIPVILMSAVHTDHGGKERSIEGGSQDFLVKPFTKKVLLNKVKTIMETILARRNREIYEMLKKRKKAVALGAL